MTRWEFFSPTLNLATFQPPPTPLNLKGTSDESNCMEGRNDEIELVYRGDEKGRRARAISRRVGGM